MPNETMRQLTTADAKKIHKDGFEIGVRKGYEMARKNPNLSHPRASYHHRYWTLSLIRQFFGFN